MRLLTSCALKICSQGNGNMHALADRVWVFTLKSENVGQKRLNARVGHGRHQSPQSRIYPSLWDGSKITPYAAAWAFGFGGRDRPWNLCWSRTGSKAQSLAVILGGDNGCDILNRHLSIARLGLPDNPVTMGTDTRGFTAVMAQRREPPDELDFFPTPLWASRALFRHNLPFLGIEAIGSARSRHVAKGAWPR
jgi:hypothetical protein